MKKGCELCVNGTAADDGHADEAQDDDGEGVEGVYEEGESAGVGGADAIEDEAGHDDVVPGAGTVGRGHYHGEGYHTECQEGGIGAELCGEGEGVEHEPEVKQVEEADEGGVEDEQNGFA